jgi:PAS domain S-box-containing protein
MLYVALLAPSIFLGLLSLYLYAKLQAAKSAATPSSLLEEEMFHASTLPMCYYRDKRFTSNKAFNYAFGSFAKEAYETLLMLPRHGQHSLDLVFDNALSKPALIYLTPLQKPENPTNDFLATIVEISTLQQSKAHLMVQKERLELALESANEAVWDWDMKSEIIYYSPRWKQIMGYEAIETPSSLSSWLNLVHPKDMAMVNERLKTHIDGSNDMLIIEHRIRQSEPLQWVKVKAKTIRDKNDHAIRMIGTLQDITQQKAQTAYDTIEKQRYIAFFDQLPAPAFIQNVQGAYVYLNHAFQKFIGFSSWHYKTTADLFNEQSAETMTEIVRLTIYEDLFIHTLSLPTQEGLIVDFDLYTFIVENENDEKLVCGFCINKSFKV